MPFNPHRSPSPRRFVACALLAAMAASGCATAGGKRVYKNRVVKSFSYPQAKIAPDPIDRYAAFAQYFKLEKDVEAIAIGIGAEYVADITGAKKTKKTFFILEKLIDMSRFKDRGRNVLYAEVGRNFDADWNREKEMTFTSNKSDFFKKLDAASTYRIRYTTFSSDPVDFTITIDADCGVTFIDELK